MGYDNNRNYEEKRNTESLFSKRIKAGKRRTYFFDVRETRGSDYFITITESKKRFNDDGYDRHKMFLYKEDFNKFLAALTDTINFVKTGLMPDFDFDAFNHDESEEREYTVSYDNNNVAAVAEVAQVEEVADTVITASVLSNEVADTTTAVDDWKM